MGSLGDDVDGEIKAGSGDPNAKFAHYRTQLSNSQFLPSPLPGEKGEEGNELRFVQSAMPFEDTVRVEDAFETQAMNLGGETQLLDDIDWFGNLDTQLTDEVIDSDGEGTDRTEVLDDGNELSDDESGRRGRCESVHGDMIQDISLSKHGEKRLVEQCESVDGDMIQDTSLSKYGEKRLVELSDALTDELHLSGSVPKFTSVRIESLRASGLAAYSSASKGTANSDSCSLLTDGQITQQFTVKSNGLKTKISQEVDRGHDIGRSDDEVKGFSHGNRCNIGCSTVKKLFTENSLIENKGHSSGGKEVPICDDGVAGLSYIDSQEPGDLSQANALACVQKLIEENKVFDNEVDLWKIDGRKSSNISAAKGAQSLAKKMTDRGTKGEYWIFDWDDGLEDEGGGDIFRRRKEEFLGTENLGQRSFMYKGNQLGVRRDNKGNSNVHNLIMIRSESKIDLRNVIANKKMMQETEMNVSRNLFNEFDKQSEADTAVGQLEALTRKEVPEMLDIGLDTQMAAEAMEALFHGEGIAYGDTNGSQQVLAVNSKDLMEGSVRSKAKQSIRSKQHSLSNKDVGVATHLLKECDTDVVMTRSKRARSDAGLNKLDRSSGTASRGSSKSGKKSLVSPRNCPENVRKDCVTDVVKTRTKRTRSDAELDELDRCHGTALRGHRSVKKQGLPEELATLTPVAHRTRQSLTVSQLKSAENVSMDYRDETRVDKLDRSLGNYSRGNSKSGKQFLVSSQNCLENVRKECDTDDVKLRTNKRITSDAKLSELDVCNGTALRNRSAKKQGLPEELATLTPVAHRTRQSLTVSQLNSAENVSTDYREETNSLVQLGGLERNKAGAVNVDASKVLNTKWNSSGLGSSQPGEPKTSKSRLIAADNDISFPRRKRSCRNLSVQLDGPQSLHAQPKSSCQRRIIEKSVSGCRMAQLNNRITRSFMTRKTRSFMTRKTRSFMPVFPDLSHRPVHKSELDCTVHNCDSADVKGKMMSNTLMGVDAIKSSDRRSNADSSPSAENVQSSDNWLREKRKSYESACTSPDICMTPESAASPVCMGSASKQSCRKNLSRSCFTREMNGLCAPWPGGPGPISEPKDTRKRRDLSDVRVLFSHHLDEDIIKQQQKIANRLKVSIASSITDATHFVTNKFVRTRNMLEAIAFGKPVVTHLWLENVGQVNYYIDEEKYIVRDSKKEKEFGFNLAVSLAHARQHPLLHGRRVLITPKTKPGKEIISSLVKAVHGQAVEKVGRSTLKDDLLILSCEEDYEICLPFLEKGAEVYSSELLLNGIVTQKLEYERHRLFADHVKKTRSTIWMKKDGHNFVPVTKRR